MSTPLTWIEAPARPRRPNTSLDVLPIHDVSASHFVGFQFFADPCSFPNPVPQDCYVQVGSAAGTAKTFGDPGDTFVSDVFGAYQGIECFLNGGLDDFRAIAQRVLEAGEHHIVDSGITHALEVAATVLTPAATTITSAIATMEQKLAEQVPGQGYIYLSPAAATYAATANLLVRELDGTLTTYLGTPVVILTESTGPASVYASGPVNIWRSPINVVDAPNVTVNLGAAIAERLYAVSIECKAWKLTFTIPASTGGPPPGDEEGELEMILGSIPASPIPDGADATIIVQTNVTPTAEVFLHYAVNGGAEVTAGEMTETNPHEFVWNVQGNATGPGDSVEVWAVSVFDGADVESNHIVIEVT